MLETYFDQTVLITLLFSAHILGDFVFQTKNDVERKGDLLVLSKHSFLHAMLAYVFSGIWSLWLIPVVIFITHGLFDLTKDALHHSFKKPLLLFLFDQAAHLIVIIGLVVSISVFGQIPLQSFWFEQLGTMFLTPLIIIIGIIVAVRVGGFIIGMAVQPYLLQINAEKEGSHKPTRGLEDGGKTIGYLERLLICLFILFNIPLGIGFLIAAKSVFRSGEVRNPENRKEAEYIIIGTFISFAYAIVIGYGVRWYVIQLSGM